MEADTKERTWFEDIQTEPADLVGMGRKIVFGALALFVIWALLAPLGSAIVAQGSAVSKGKNKVLQHRTGGTVVAIHAREGDLVKAGQVLFELDPATDQAELTRLKARQSTLLALKQRLEAEKQYAVDGSAVKFANFQLRGISNDTNARLTKGGFGSSDGDGEKIIDAVWLEQEREFETGRRAITAELAALTQRIKALQKRKDGLRRRIASISKQVLLLQKQHSSAQALVREGHIARQQGWEIENQLLTANGELATVQSEYSSTSNEIEETREQFNLVKHNDERTTSGRLTEVLGELGQISDQYKAVKAVVENTEIKSPSRGTLLRSILTTIGGVAQAGEVLGEIVPLGAELEMRVRVMPQDISHVHIGQLADVTITALNPRIFDSLTGKVTFVAADASTDPNTMEQYFTVSIGFDEPPINPDGTPLVTPGMTGDVFIQRESRTFASYLIRPLTDSFAHAFTEN